MTKLTSEERDALPDSAFGLPDERAYPIPDKAHARNAKARAAEEFHAGRLTEAQKREIDARSDRVLAEP